MKPLRHLALLAAACGMQSASAEPVTLGLHTVSYHTKPGFNNTNPGLYLRAANGLTLGFYRNSYSRDSAYAGKTWETSGVVSLALTAGVVTGYPQAKAMPLLAPSVALHGGDFAARLTVIPKPPRHGTAAVAHLTLEWAQ